MTKQLEVLLLEDEEAYGQIISVELSVAGIASNVIFVDNEAGFRRHVTNEDIDLVIADYNLGLELFNGMDALKIFREKYFDNPFIFHTGKDDFDLVADVMGRGATYFVPKMSDREIGKPGKLIETVKRALDTYNIRKANAENIFLLEESQRVSETGSYRTDFRTGLVQFSTTLGTIFGIDKSYDLTVEAWTDIVHPEDRKMMVDYVTNNFLRDKQPFDREYRIVRKNDGKTRFVHGRGAVVTDKDGTVTGMIGTIRDITSRKEGQERLKEKEENYSTLIENAEELIFTMSLSQIINTFNPAVERVSGYTRDELTGMPVNKFMTKKSYEKSIEMLKEKLSGNMTHTHYEVEAVRKNGEIIILDASTFFRNVDGKPYEIFVIARDVTERKKMEKELMHAQRMEGMGAIAAGIAHDFNNILGITMGHASALQLTAPESMKNSLDAIVSASKRGAGIVKQMLTFARKDEIKLSLMNLKYVLNDVPSFITEITKTNESLGIHYDVLSELGKTENIIGDSGQLTQVLHNILNNAYHAMPAGGKFIISSKDFNSTSPVSLRDAVLPAGEYVMFSIADTGTGISDAIYKRMFDPFFTSKPKGQGTGLGLAIVKTILEEHKGYINVISELNKGTTFEFYIPAAKGEVPQMITPAINGKHGKGTILIADDEIFLRDALQSNLIEHGYKVLTASSGDEATEILKKNSGIDLLLTDIHMPGKSGIEIAKEVEKRNSGPYIIGITGMIDAETRAAWPSRYKLIQKPFSPEEISEAVYELMHKKPADK